MPQAPHNPSDCQAADWSYLLSLFPEFALLSVGAFLSLTDSEYEECLKNKDPTLAQTLCLRNLRNTGGNTTLFSGPFPVTCSVCSLFGCH
jgi:hypothetical protein